MAYLKQTRLIAVIEKLYHVSPEGRNSLRWNILLLKSHLHKCPCQTVTSQIDILEKQCKHQSPSWTQWNKWKASAFKHFPVMYFHLISAMFPSLARYIKGHATGCVCYFKYFPGSLVGRKLNLSQWQWKVNACLSHAYTAFRLAQWFPNF